MPHQAYHAEKWRLIQRKQLITDRIDKVLHKFWGYIILLGVLGVLFEGILLLYLSMDAIEWVFGAFSTWLSGVLPQNWFSDLLVNGLITGQEASLYSCKIMILLG